MSAGHQSTRALGLLSHGLHEWRAGVDQMERDHYILLGFSVQDVGGKKHSFWWTQEGVIGQLLAPKSFWPKTFLVLGKYST